ncbi:dentin sialophosphoprotein-like [Ptychodera flava]|uniref:dentin sialophosphoprotein-like n=1 Tax=Ptychodera flava TaxID=63121 RepID=UPI003969DA1A
MVSMQWKLPVITILVFLCLFSRKVDAISCQDGRCENDGGVDVTGEQWSLSWKWTVIGALTSMCAVTAILGCLQCLTRQGSPTLGDIVSNGANPRRYSAVRSKSSESVKDLEQEAENKDSAVIQLDQLDYKYEEDLPRDSEIYATENAKESLADKIDTLEHGPVGDSGKIPTEDRETPETFEYVNEKENIPYETDLTQEDEGDVTKEDIFLSSIATSGTQTEWDDDLDEDVRISEYGGDVTEGNYNTSEQIMVTETGDESVAQESIGYGVETAVTEAGYLPLEPHFDSDDQEDTISIEDMQKSEDSDLDLTEKGSSKESAEERSITESSHHVDGIRDDELPEVATTLVQDLVRIDNGKAPAKDHSHTVLEVQGYEGFWDRIEADNATLEDTEQMIPLQTPAEMDQVQGYYDVQSWMSGIEHEILDDPQPIYAQIAEEEDFNLTQSDDVDGSLEQESSKTGVDNEPKLLSGEHEGHGNEELREVVYSDDERKINSDSDMPDKIRQMVTKEASSSNDEREPTVIDEYHQISNPVFQISASERDSENPTSQPQKSTDVGEGVPHCAETNSEGVTDTLPQESSHSTDTLKIMFDDGEQGNGKSQNKMSPENEAKQRGTGTSGDEIMVQVQEYDEKASDPSKVSMSLTAPFGTHDDRQVLLSTKSKIVEPISSESNVFEGSGTRAHINVVDVSTSELETTRSQSPIDEDNSMNSTDSLEVKDKKAFGADLASDSLPASDTSDDVQSIDSLELVDSLEKTHGPDVSACTDKESNDQASEGLSMVSGSSERQNIVRDWRQFVRSTFDQTDDESLLSTIDEQEDSGSNNMDASAEGSDFEKFHSSSMYKVPNKAFMNQRHSCSSTEENSFKSEEDTLENYSRHEKPDSDGSAVVTAQQLSRCELYVQLPETTNPEDNKMNGNEDGESGYTATGNVLPKKIGNSVADKSENGSVEQYKNPVQIDTDDRQPKREYSTSHPQETKNDKPFAALTFSPEVTSNPIHAEHLKQEEQTTSPAESSQHHHGQQTLVQEGKDTASSKVYKSSIEPLRRVNEMSKTHRESDKHTSKDGYKTFHRGFPRSALFGNRERETPIQSPNYVDQASKLETSPKQRDLISKQEISNTERGVPLRSERNTVFGARSQLQNTNYKRLSSDSEHYPDSTTSSSIYQSSFASDEKLQHPNDRSDVTRQTTSTSVFRPIHGSGSSRSGMQADLRKPTAISPASPYAHVQTPVRENPDEKGLRALDGRRREKLHSERHLPSNGIHTSPSTMKDTTREKKITKYGYTVYLTRSSSKDSLSGTDHIITHETHVISKPKPETPPSQTPPARRISERMQKPTTRSQARADEMRQTSQKLFSQMQERRPSFKRSFKEGSDNVSRSQSFTRKGSETPPVKHKRQAIRIYRNQSVQTERSFIARSMHPYS